MSRISSNSTPQTIPDENSALLDEEISDSSQDDIPNVVEELSTAKLAIILVSIWIGVFLAALDSTVISTLLAPISSAFQSFATISWITTSYLISQAALQPLFGKLTDIYGRRTGLLVSNTLFALGTAMCGLAKTEKVLVLGRIIAGAGGGGMTAISSIVASDLVPLRRRGIIQGGGNIAYGSGAALGGLYGGLMADSIGWRMAFMAQIPFILISGIFAFVFVRIPVKKMPKARHQRIDYLGAMTLVIFLVLFLFAVNTGGTKFPWKHPLILGCLSLSFIFLAIFVFVETKQATEPIIPLGILSDQTVMASCATFLFMVMSVFCAYFYIPIYSMLCGQSATGAGLRLTPFAVGISAGSLGSGIIMNKTGRYYTLGLCAMSVYNLGVGLFSTLNLHTPASPQFFYFFLFGLGYGAELTVGLIALIASVGHSEQATTTSASYLFRATGGTIGAAIGSAVFQRQLRISLLKNLGNSSIATDIIDRITQDFEEVLKLEGPWKTPVVDAYMQALHSVFYVTFGLGLIAMMTTALLKEHKLHRTLDRQ
ncbi:major facilitator superfamily domain-containing protein [Geopyxis carbonaria]|nr:major facilitator superfamily domain-containing protein [Geopyxis carbonaria]